MNVTLKFWLSIGAEDHGKVEALLAEYPSYVDATHIGGMTGLMLSIICRNATMMQVFLQSGASIDKTDFSGKTALMHASSIGFNKGVKLLIDKANVHARDHEGLNALQHALNTSRLDVVKHLFCAGIEINVNELFRSEDKFKRIWNKCTFVRSWIENNAHLLTNENVIILKKCRLSSLFG